VTVRCFPIPDSWSITWGVNMGKRRERVGTTTRKN